MLFACFAAKKIPKIPFIMVPKLPLCPEEIPECINCNPFENDASGYVDCVNGVLGPEKPFEVPECSMQLPDKLYEDCMVDCDPDTNTAVGLLLCLKEYSEKANPVKGALNKIKKPFIEPPVLPKCPYDAINCTCDPKLMDVNGYIECMQPYYEKVIEIPYCSAKLSYKTYADCVEYCQTEVADSTEYTAKEYEECLIEAIKVEKESIVGKWFHSKLGDEKLCDPCTDTECDRECDPWKELCPFNCPT